MTAVKKKYSIIDILICAVILLSPLLQQHKGIVINGGWTALFLGIPLCLVRLFPLQKKMDGNIVCVLLILMAYYLWTLVDHGFSFSDAFKVATLFLYYYIVSHRKFPFALLMRIAVIIVLAACAGLVAQYFCYYILHFKLQFLNVRTLLETSTRWYARINSREVSGTFYRPSAFFLEPSHMFIFSFPPTLYMLFSDNANKRTRTIGFIMVGGIMMSTSGMGIVFSLGCIVAYFVMYRKPYFNKGNIFNFFTPKTFIILVSGLALIVILYNNVDIVHKSIVRIIAENDVGYNAIAGRTEAGNDLLSALKWKDMIIGVSDAMGELGAALSGFQATLYKFGAVGLLLSYAYYIYGTINVRRNFRYHCIILLVISFFCTHTHNYFYMLYYSSFIFEGLKCRSKDGTQRKIRAKQLLSSILSGSGIRGTAWRRKAERYAGEQQ